MSFGICTPLLSPHPLSLARELSTWVAPSLAACSSEQRMARKAARAVEAVFRALYTLAKYLALALQRDI